jgi:hypothetical protein
MRPGLTRTLLNLVRRRAGIVADPSGNLSDDVGWLVAPDGYELAALQAERHADPDDNVVAHAADLDRDIARLRAGWRPDDTDLAQAPTLLAEGLHLSMSADGMCAQFHGPVFDADGRPVSQGRITSLVIAVDTKAGTWARTLNRFYRLAHSDSEGDRS